MTTASVRPSTAAGRAMGARVLGALWLLALLACEGSGTMSENPQPGLTTHKVQLSAEQATQLQQQGVQVHELADYGTYKLVQVDEQALAALPEEAGAELRDDYDDILLNAGVINTASQHGQSLKGMKLPERGKRFHLVQFAGPIKPEWYQALQATGVQVVTYIPNNAYLVYGDASALSSLQGHTKSAAASAIQWNGDYLDDYKLHAAVQTTETPTYAIQLIQDEEANPETLALIRQLQSRDGRIQEGLGYINVVAYLTRKDLYEIATRPDVVSILPRPARKLFDERQNVILAGQITGNGPTAPGYLAWLASKGFTQAQFTASSFGVDVSDSGLDNGTVTPNHFGLYVGGNVVGTSRVAYARLEGSANSGSTLQGCDGHGTLNAHIIAGYASQTGAPFTDEQGFTHGLGVAPFVKVGSSVVFDPDTFTDPDYEDLQSRAYRDTMRISSNSWGADSDLYDSDAQRYDALVRDAQPTGSAVPAPGNQEMVILFAAGNAGPSLGTVGTPGTAKNVITVGASENVRAFGAPDLCNTPDSEANSLYDVASFSSRGPTADGRKKPDLMAPGTHVAGGVAQAAGQRSNPPGNPNGQALSCFDAGGVCGGPNNDYYPVGQQWYSASSGTSHSTPAVAGGAALVRQYFINQGFAPPSAAMTKAYLMNSTRYMTGVSANDSLYSNHQGMGLLDLGMALDGTSRLLDDQNPANVFTSSGQTRTFSGVVADSTRPFRVTLAWTDAPGSTTGSAWRNNLDLTVTLGGSTYRGNVFTGSSSVTGGTADSQNNVESVFLPAGTEGAYTVTVTATNINSDGVPNTAPALDQDFALIAYNSCASATEAPDGVSAAVNADNRIDLTWTPNGAASYNIYRSTAAGGPYTRVGSATAPPYQDTTVSGGTTYYYVIRAVSCAESAKSPEVSATATGLCRLPPAFAGLNSATNAETATCANTLAWSAATPSCGGTLTYSVYRSTTPGFTPSVANRITTGLTGTSFADDLNLSSGATYYYVVRATETSNTTLEETNTAVLSSVPTSTVTPGARYFDDFDGNRPANASSYWLVATGNANTINIVSGCHYQSPTRAYRFGATNSNCSGTYPNNSNVILSLGGNGSVAGINGFTLPASTLNPQLTFNVWYDLEPGYDGAWLVYSTTSATGPWTAVSDTASSTLPYISAGGYDGTLGTGATQIWTGESAGANGSLKPVTVNLSALAGQKVWFGFRISSDNSVTEEGFYVDNVRLTADSFASCTTQTPPPGPAVAYRVTGLPASSPAGTPVTFTVTALDAVGLMATGYTGSATFTSTDAQAVLPPATSFTAGVASDVPMTFRTLGAQSVIATASTDTSLTGSASSTVTAGAPAGLTFTVQPANATAGASIAPAVRVGLVDAFGNPVTTGTNSITMALGANPGGSTLSGTTTVAAVNGVATFTNLSLNKVGEGYTLVASSPGLAGTTSSGFRINPAAASRLAFITQPATSAVSEPLTPAVQVAVQDVFGNTTSSTANVTLALGANPAGAALSGTTTVAAVNGVATFGDLSINRVGAGYTLTATSGTLMAATSSAFNTRVGGPTRLAFRQQPTSTPAGTALSPVSVEVLDVNGNRADSTSSITLSIQGEGGTLAGTTTVAAINGVATFSDLSIARVAVGYRLTARANGLAEDTSSAFDISHGPAAALAFKVAPSAAQQGTLINPAIQVAVEDAFGNLVTSATNPITLSLGNNPGNGALSGSKTLSATRGVATFSDLSVSQAGQGYTLQASSGSLPTVTSPAFDITQGAVAKLVFRAVPSSLQASDTLPSIEVELQDAQGNRIPNGTLDVTMSLGENLAGGVLIGGTTVTAVDGVATFTELGLRKAGTGYTLVASAPGFAGATSAAFTVTPGPAATYALVLPASVTAGQETTLSATAYDAYGNQAAPYSGSVRVTSSDTTATVASTATFVEGRLQGLAVTFKSLGLRTITLTDADNASLTATAQTNVTPFAQPTVAVTDPEAGMMVSGTVSITATGAVAPGTTVAQLAILVDGVEIASGTEATLTGSWDSSKAAPGAPHTLTAVITDGAGNVAHSAPVTVTTPAKEEDSGCGCGATSGAEASLYFGLLALAWYAHERKRRAQKAA